MQIIIGGNTYDLFIQADPTTGMPGPAIDFSDAIALGLVHGYQKVYGYGDNPDISSDSVPEDVWTGGGAYPWITSATNLQVRSTSDQDAPGGTGATKIEVITLDADFNQIEQVIELNGLTPVTIPAKVFRINTAVVTEAGTTGACVGNIIIEDIGETPVTRAIIPAGRNTTKQSAFTVPIGNTLVIKQILFGIGSKTGSIGEAATMALYFKDRNGVKFMPLEIPSTSSDVTVYEPNPPLTLDEGGDFSLIITEATDNNMHIIGTWRGFLRENY